MKAGGSQLRDSPAFSFSEGEYGNRMRRHVLLPSLLLVAPLTACGPAGTDPGPGGVTVDEAKALDEAAAMLEERRLPPEALPSAAASATELAPTAGET